MVPGVCMYVCALKYEWLVFFKCTELGLFTLVLVFILIGHRICNK